MGYIWVNFFATCVEDDIVSVADGGKGVCVDPGVKGAILETGGPSPPESGKGWQLAPDSGGEGT
jgi:hypothetical protein